MKRVRTTRQYMGLEEDRRGDEYNRNTLHAYFKEQKTLIKSIQKRNQVWLCVPLIPTLGS